MGLAGCDERRPQPLTIDNALTADEIAAGRLTPEVMWKMSRAGGSSLSPDGRTLLYQQTDYSISENRGVTTLWTLDMESKRTTRLTDTSSNNLSAQWNADGSAIYFLSDRSGTMQVWRMNASGGDATRITGDGDGEGVPDVEGFGVSPDERHIWWVQTVHVAARKSSDLYEDMPRSKARIYDDLMARHWDYWDEGDYRHIFVGELGAGTVTGGTDIIAAIINKYKDVTLGRMIMLCDVVIISSCYFVFHDWRRVIFGFVTLFVIGFVLDYIVNSARQSVQFFIFSKEYDKIADRITKETHRGVTVLDGTGWYSKHSVKVLVVLAYKRQSIDIFRLVKDIDPNAFISQSSVIGVYGEGFDRLKVK